MGYAKTPFGKTERIGEGSPDVFKLDDEVWNISAGYVYLKILKLMIEIDELETVAMFGAVEMSDIVYPQSEINLKRREALYRYAEKLQQLIDNVYFEIKKMGHKELLKDLNERLIILTKYMDGAFIEFHNTITKTTELKIHEEFFRILLNKLRDVKRELNIPINEANIIFRHTKKATLDDLIKDIKEYG